MNDKKVFFDKQPITNNAILELISGGFLDDALILINKKLESDNNDLLLIYKGIVLNALEKHEEALSIFIKLYEKEKSILNLKNIFITFLSLKRFEEANIIANEILKNNPNEIEYLLEEYPDFHEEKTNNDTPLSFISPSKLVEYMNLGYTEESLDIANSILKNNPQEISFLEVKGSALYRLERYKESIDIFDEILKIDPNNEKALIFKGNILITSSFNKLDEALFCINKVIENNPNDNLLKQKGAILFELKKYQEALNIFNNILKNDSKNIEILNYKGRCLLVLNRLKESLDVFNDILHIDPNNTYAKKNKELVLSKMPI